MSQQVVEHGLHPALCRERSVSCLCCSGSVWGQWRQAWVYPQGTHKSPSRGTGQVSTSSPATLCPIGSVGMAKGLCGSYDPGEQDTCPGRAEPQVHAYLPWLSVQDRALDGKSPFTAVPVPWFLHSAVLPLCCLHTCFFAKSRQLKLPSPAPWCPMHCAGCRDRGLMAGTGARWHLCQQQNPHWGAATVDTRLGSPV